MSIEFYQKQIENYENYGILKDRHPYIGYFNPKGKLIDYNVLYSEKYLCDHGSYYNPISQCFIYYLSYIIRDTDVSERQKFYDEYFSKHHKKAYKYSGISENVVLGGIDTFSLFDGWSSSEEKDLDNVIENIENHINKIKNNKAKGVYISDETSFMYDLLLFFRNAYSNKLFFNAINKKIYIDKIDTIYPEYLDIRNRSENENQWKRRFIENQYIIDDVAGTLMSYFKDICVQYLGYDSLERFMPNGNIVPVRQNYDDESNDFLKIPRVITTSNPNINERFFNYLLMDWRVDVLPKYRFNPNTNKYEEDEIIQYHISSIDEEYGKEIDKIKKLVPLTERPKYFRK